MRRRSHVLLLVDRGSGHAAPVCFCARRRRCSRPSRSRSRGAGVQQSPAIAVDPDAPLQGGRRRGGPERRRPVPAHGDGLVDSTGRARAWPAATLRAPRAVALRRSARHRLGSRRAPARAPVRERLSGRGGQHEQQHLHASATTASSSRPPTTAARTGTRRCRSRPARRGPRRSSRRSRPTAPPRPRLRRVHEAHLRGLPTAPAARLDSEIYLIYSTTAGARGSSPGACRRLPLRHRSLP